MKTVVELGRDGTHTIFHRTSTAAWTHAPGERYRYWTDRGPQAGRGKDRYGWVEMRCDCPQISDKAADKESGEVVRSRTPEPPTVDAAARTKAGAA